jgi:hypothetical protein
MEDASVAMSNMSKVASNLSAVINSQLDAAMASAIAKTLNISGLTQNYTNDLARYGAQAPRTMAAQNALNNALQRAFVMGQQATGALNNAAGGAAKLGAEAAGAAGRVNYLAEAIAGVHSKTVDVVVNTYYHAIGPGGARSPALRQHGGPVEAGTPYTVGEGGREIFVPDVPGHVLSSPDTERFLTGSTSSAVPVAMAGQAVTLHATIHVPVQVDGETIMTATQPAVLRYNIRNGNAQAGTMAPPV